MGRRHRRRLEHAARYRQRGSSEPPGFDLISSTYHQTQTSVIHVTVPALLPFYGYEKELGTMIDKCANPQCDEPLVYLRSGLYAVDPHRDSQIQRRHFFWLCGACCRKYKLQFREDDAPELVPVSAPDLPCSFGIEASQVRRIFINQPRQEKTVPAQQVPETAKVLAPIPVDRRVREHRGHFHRRRVEQRTCA